MNQYTKKPKKPDNFKVEFRNNRMYYVFKDEYEATEYYDMISKSVNCSIVPFGGYLNALEF